MTQTFLHAALLCLSLSQAQQGQALENGAIRIQVFEVSDLPEEAVPVDSPLWRKASAHRLHLNRTPPLYEGDPVDDGACPEASVRVLRGPGNRGTLRIDWEDATDDTAPADTRYPDGGEDHIYKRHSGDFAAFPDACCIMVPAQRGRHASYPSLMMGEKRRPVQLLFWRAGHGFEKLNAHGRATVAKADEGPDPSGNGTGASLSGNAKRRADGWSVVMAVPSLEPETPLCFAIWDGNQEQRDGLKFFSLWYEVE